MLQGLEGIGTGLGRGHSRRFEGLIRPSITNDKACRLTDHNLAKTLRLRPQKNLPSGYSMSQNLTNWDCLTHETWYLANAKGLGDEAKDSILKGLRKRFLESHL